jgi:hypothetical protein
MFKRVWKHRLMQRTAYAIVVVAVSFFSFCWFVKIESITHPRTFIGIARSCHPVWKDLACGRIYEGQPVDEVIAKTKPAHVDRRGVFVSLDYHEPWSLTVMRVIAKNGKLVSAHAGSCTWDHTFFDSMSEQDGVDFWVSYEADKSKSE